MKKILVFAMASVIGLSSCKKSNPQPTTNNPSTGTGTTTGWEKVSESIPTNGSLRTVCSIGTTLFVGTDMSGYKSTDGGKTWTSCTKSLITQIKNEPSGFGLDTIVSRLFTDGSVLYASSQQTVQNSIMNPQRALIYKSTDNGDTWTRVFNNLYLTTPSVTLFTGNNIYLKNGDGIAVSTDNGSSWQVNNNIPEESGLSSNNMVSDGTKFYLTNKGVFCSSSDNCKTFQKINNNSISDAIWFASIGSKVFTLANDGVYTSSDAGNTWSLTNAPFGKSGYNNLLYSNENNLYGVDHTDYNIFKSTDAGTTWKSLGKCSDAFPSYLIRNNGYLYAFTSKGVYRIAD